MSHDTLVHRAVRPMVRRLARTGLHPNAVTAARIVMAVTAAGFFATGTAGLLKVGCCLFVAAALLDRVDGELARQTGKFTAWGHRLDLVGDCSADALAFIGLGYGSRLGPLGLWAPLLGLSAASAVIALFWQLNIRHADADSETPDRTFDPDDAMLLVPIIIICAGPPPILLLAGLLTPVIAGAAIWRRVTL